MSHKDFNLELLCFAVEHNYFFYEGDYYLQQTGVAMGKKFAPSLTNPFMALWENEVIFTDMHPNLKFWLHYIDNAFFIWRGDENSLHMFLRYLNNNEWSIKLTYKYSSNFINFLDVTILRHHNKLFTFF